MKNLKEIMSYAKTSKVGLTEEEIRKYFGDLVAKKFGLWVDGQVTALGPNKELVVLPETIAQFSGIVLAALANHWD